jgi:hypothetical protein
VGEATQITTIDDLQLDERNANQGTDRGEFALRESLIRFGVGRGVLADRNGKLIGGNKTRQALAALGEEVQVITVPATGNTLVVTQRVDLDLDDPDDPTARELAIADNRVAELDLAWDAQRIAEASDLDLAAFFHQHELDAILNAVEEEAEQEDQDDEHDPVPEMEVQPFEHFDYVMLVFRNTWDWAKAVDALGIEERGFSFTSTKGVRHRKVGLCRVIDGRELLSLLEERCASSSPAAAE